MTWVLSFLMKFRVPLAIGLLVMALGLSHWRAQHLKHKWQDAKAALYVPDALGKPTHQTWESRARGVETTLVTCNGSLERQNGATLAAKVEGDRKAAVAAQAIQAAKSEAKAANDRATSILGLKSREPDTCKALLDVERQITESETP